MRTLNRDTLNDLAETFYSKALAYLLHFEASEKRMAQDMRKKLRDEYGFEKMMPAIPWVETFGAEKADSDALDQLIIEYLNKHNAPENAAIMPRDRLKNFLWDKARKEAHAIIKALSA